MQANGGVAQQASQMQKDMRDKDREIKKLSQELRRKESALAETAALLVLRKKADAIWGAARTNDRKRLKTSREMVKRN